MKKLHLISCVLLFLGFLYSSASWGIWFKTQRISSDALKDGDTIVLNAASTPKAYDEYLAGDAMTKILDKNCVFVLVKGPVQEDKASFYLKHLSTGKYIHGYKGDNVIALEEQNTATNFSLVCALDSAFLTYQSGDYEQGWDDASVSFVHKESGGSNKDFYFFLTNNFDKMECGYHSDSRDIIAWNVYGVYEDTTKAANLKLLLDSMKIEESKYVVGTNPGALPESVKQGFDDLLDAAQKAVDSHASNEECLTIMQNLRNYKKTMAKSWNPIEDGYYYIVSAYSKFMEVQGKEKAMFATNDFLGWNTFDESNLAYVFKVTKQSDGNYAISSGLTSQYINTSAAGATETMSNLLTTNQIFEYAGYSRFKISNTANLQHYVPNNNAYGQTEMSDIYNLPDDYANVEGYDTYGWHTWYLRPVQNEDLITRAQKNVKSEASSALKEVLDDAEKSYSKCFAFDVDDNTPLITEANDDDPDHNQISSNAKMPDMGGTEWGRYAYLIDGDPNTFFISKHTSAATPLPMYYHNLIFRLNDNSVEAFAFKFVQSATWPTFTWEDLDIYASNDTTSEENWVKITSLTNLPSADYTSPIIPMWNTYKYIRFDVTKTYNNLRVGGGCSFAVGDIQLYPAVVNDVASAYYNKEGLSDACDQLKTLIAKSKELIANNTTTTDDIEALKASTANVNLLYKGDDRTEELAALIDTAKTLYNKCVSFKADTSKKLIYEADDNDPAHNQFWSNAKMPDMDGTEWGRYAYLIDEDASTFFFSKHTSAAAPLPAGFHNLCVDLKENPVDGFVMKFTQSSTWPGFTWRSLDIYASNDTTSEENWVKVKALNDLPNASEYFTPAIQFYGTYRYIKFDVRLSYSGYFAGGGQPFVVGDLQLYPAIIDTESTALYNIVSGLNTECDNLYQTILEAKEKVNDKTAKQEDVDNLKAAIDAVLEIKDSNKSDELALALDTAMALYQQCTIYKSDLTTPLIYEADDNDPEHNQIWSNAKMPDMDGTEWGRYAYLIDNDPSTFFISKHTSAAPPLPANYHNLCFDLKQHPVNSFVMKFTQSSTWPSFSWRSLDFYASNDTTKETNWVKLNSLNNLSANTEYYTPAIQLYDTYRYIRIDVSSSYCGYSVGGGQPFAVGDIQLYPAVIDLNNKSLYATIDGLAPECDKLYALIPGAQSKVSKNIASKVDLDELNAQIAVVRKLMSERKSDELLATIDSAKTVYLKCTKLKAETSKKLIYEANDDDPAHNQIWSNAKMPDLGGTNWGRYANIIDEDPTTFFFTKHTSAAPPMPTTLHNLCFDLKENPVNAFSFEFTQCATWPTFTWSEVVVYASNDTTGTGNWHYVADLSKLPNQAAPYMTDPIVLFNNYRYLRFDIKDTYNRLRVGGGYSFAIGDLQLYQSVMDDTAPYLKIQGLNTECDKLCGMIPDAQKAIEDSTASQADVDKLMAQITAINNLLNKTDFIKSATPDQKEELVDVYNMEGKLIFKSKKRSEALKALRKGLYIVGKKKMNIK